MKGFVLLCICVTSIFICLHVLLICGIPLGEYVLGGKYKKIPLKLRWKNILIAIGFLYIDEIYIAILQGKEIGLLSNWSIILYTLFLGYSIYGKLVKTPSKKEKMLLGPLTIIGFISSLIIVIDLVTI